MCYLLRDVFLHLFDGAFGRSFEFGFEFEEFCRLFLVRRNESGAHIRHKLTAQQQRTHTEPARVSVRRPTRQTHNTSEGARTVSRLLISDTYLLTK